MQVMQEQLPAHALVADGVFYPSGSFRVLSPIPETVLTEALRQTVLTFLCNDAGFDHELAKRMRNWQHSGFSVHNRIQVKANDAEGRQQLARDPPWPIGATIPLTYHPVPDIAKRDNVPYKRYTTVFRQGA